MSVLAFMLWLCLSASGYRAALAGSGGALGDPRHLEQVASLVAAGVHGAILVIERRWPAAAASWGIHGISSRWRLLSVLAFMLWLCLSASGYRAALAGSGGALGDPRHLEQVTYLVGTGVHGIPDCCA
ncbi:hypothetical protein ACEUBT_18910 [Aeromonas bivalvium]|uniref:hypothetical protein n=1 Tax=Aeromonas bivalvium TaxID=440079 RepID=UPI0038D23D8D